MSSNPTRFSSRNLTKILEHQEQAIMVLSILMAAGDTFRAAASDQLEIWAERTGCEIVSAEKEKAKAWRYDLVRGFPDWLKYVPGISFRTDNEPFKSPMKGFTEKIVNLMNSEKMFESQGGPIILSEVENEYRSVGKAYGGAGHNYMTWVANMAVELGTGVPWVMCKQDDVPDPFVITLISHDSH
ncbi:hypothetical protein L2E82_22957 [Cichorium intybus]|uniref:Uncharacterized protein n=1 Tax=Cichorium intybus TaxID=13427 RepID=A0ACB9DZI2_CICIN|nr:hypothetical protein L2E82_22957 [Cichorium intybus]